MRAPRKKRRSFSQMMEEESGILLRGAMPKEWVIHGYAPDYGIDGAVEIFQFVDEDENYAETLGETFFFQMKSTKSCEIIDVDVPWRVNVEKGPYEVRDDSVEMQVVRYNFDDTDELLTIEAMGSGVVVALFLVCLESKRVFFLNLTDYVEKVLTPESPEWREQGSKVIHIPVLNEVAPNTPVSSLLRFYALRPKLMALFTKIHFQWAELNYGRSELSPEGCHKMALHFIDVLLRFDVWGYEGWALLGTYMGQLEQAREHLLEVGPGEGTASACADFWFRLDAIGRTFEDVTREWGLPTALGRMSSYP